jgi:hypothetical protein
MPQPDEITLKLPHEREFHRVAQLVLGGLEDLQLGLAAILDRTGPGGEITVSMSLENGTLETCVGPVDLAGELAETDEGLSLGRILSAVVDEVKLDGDHVRLIKKIDRIKVG